MARSFQARFLAVVRANEERMTRLFADLADAVIADVNRRADADGMVPRSALPELQATVGNRVTALFLGRTRSGERAPFEVLPNGDVWPLSPYMRALWGSIRDVVRVPVEQHAGLMAVRLPRDVAAVMRQATDDPLAASREPVREFFRPNPLAKYQPPHTWVDPNGYTLSDRVWNVAGDTRRRLDLYLDRAIAEGRGARAMASELEQFLVPGRSLIRTKAPYGTDASYDAMRLARTEISRAHASAQEASALMNPFVEGLRVALSRRHPKRDICDDAAEAGPWKVSEIPEQYRLPLHPHCVTPGQLVTTRRGMVAIEDVRAGDVVVTHTGRYRTVVAAWATPHDGMVYRVRTDSGSFELTGNHLVMLHRGWVKAEAMQPGDQVLYTGIGAFGDLDLGVADDMPAAPGQPCVTAGVPVGVASVPAASVTFDGDPLFDQGNVNEVAANAVFAGVGNVEPIQCGAHGGLDGSRVGESYFADGFEHGHQAGIASELGAADFAPHAGALGGVGVARHIPALTDAPEDGTGHLAARAVVLFPTGGNGVGHGSHGDSMPREKVAQDAVGDSVAAEYLGAGKPFFEVDAAQEGGDGLTVFGFEAQGMPAGGGDSVLGDVAGRSPLHGEAADGANDHDSLLSLSPEYLVGHGSGNPLVSEVANPTQALPHYSTIRAIEPRRYTGPVYNMEVEDDHSYTVNGAAVHNCLCSYRYEMIDAKQRDAMLAALRADVQKTRAELVNLVGPLLVDQFTDVLLNGRMTTVRTQPAPVSVAPPPPDVPLPEMPVRIIPADEAEDALTIGRRT